MLLSQEINLARRWFNASLCGHAKVLTVKQGSGVFCITYRTYQIFVPLPRT